MLIQIKFIIIILFFVNINLCNVMATNNLFNTSEENLLSNELFVNSKIGREFYTYSSKDNINSLTARIAIIIFLLDQDTTNLSKSELEYPFIICRQIIHDNPNTWQAELANFFLVFEYGCLGNIEQQLLVINKKLNSIDFNLLDKTNNQFLNAIRMIYSQNIDTNWKDILLAIKATILCEDGKYFEANNISQSLRNVKHQKLVQDRIRLEVKRQ